MLRFLVPEPSQTWHHFFGGFGHFWHTCRGPIGPIFHTFVHQVWWTKVWSMGPIGPREVCQKWPKPPKKWCHVWDGSGTKKRSIWARVFYVFYWCKKQKIELFFWNDLKSLQNGPKHPKTVFKCHFGVFYGNWGANIGDFDHFGDFWSKILICPSLNGLGYLWGGCNRILADPIK